ncbi:MAG: COX15/CtaA family protein [Saprospiraceae bacterium]
MVHYTDETRISKTVKIWLITGLLMIVLQVVIGGVTRLTGSGLSITRWEIVTGSLPPLTEQAWQEAFDLYKATPQYAKINEGMALADFKFIYFWEYFHRLWARLMFFVFVVPFAWFLLGGMFSRRMVPQLLSVVFLAGLEGFFGWIMVASGLRDRPWVNAYNLTLHLCMALVIFVVLLWITFRALHPRPPVIHSRVLKRFSWALVLVAFVQIAFGAMMSGTKAGLFFPTWPDMHGSYLPDILLDSAQWTGDSFLQYDTNPFIPALTQFLHRNTAYLLTTMCLFFFWKANKLPLCPIFLRANRVMIGALVLQVGLGILTLVNCVSNIPVVLGVLHQAGALLLMGTILFVAYLASAGKLFTPVDNN